MLDALRLESSPSPIAWELLLPDQPDKRSDACSLFLGMVPVEYVSTFACMNAPLSRSTSPVHPPPDGRTLRGSWRKPRCGGAHNLDQSGPRRSRASTLSPATIALGHHAEAPRPQPMTRTSTSARYTKTRRGSVPCRRRGRHVPVGMMNGSFVHGTKMNNTKKLRQHQPRLRQATAKEVAAPTSLLDSALMVTCAGPPSSPA